MFIQNSNPYTSNPLLDNVNIHTNKVAPIAGFEFAHL